MTSSISVGTVASPAMLSGDYNRRKELIQRVGDSGIDHVFLADHVSFIKGLGMDALINAASVAGMHPTLKICIGVYLLALRHPVPVARQLATLSQSAPGRITLGVGVGGEDRHEMEVCGVNPATRGKQTNECLEIVRALMTGKSFSFKGDFFEIEDALIKPAIRPSMPILVGGRSNAAIKRAALFSEGWLGVWCSAKRFASAIDQVQSIAQQNGRNVSNWGHGLQVWVGVDADESKAKKRVATEMQDFYNMPFTAFEKYSPYGSPEKIAEFLQPYKEAGCRLFNIKPCAEDEETGVEAVAKVKALLQ